MLDRNRIGLIALCAVFMLSAVGAQAFDDTIYPDWKGQWRPIGGPMRFDPGKPWGPGQEAPLTAEYQAIFQANLADQAAGGQGLDRDYECHSPGMPRVTNGYGQMEILVTPDTTYILIQHIHDDRRIFTDGRDWSAATEPTFLGYSIGKWIDTDADGRYDVLEVETRNFKGPRVYDTSGIPLHSDNQTVVKERIHLDSADRNVLHDEVTVSDHALTRPWTVTKRYQREPNPRPYWREVNCSENNNHVRIGNENYMLSADGLLMPTKKGQKPPDLRFFGAARRAQ
jgi:hypothetical protein